MSQKTNVRNRPQHMERTMTIANNLHVDVRNRRMNYTQLPIENQGFPKKCKFQNVTRQFFTFSEKTKKHKLIAENSVGSLESSIRLPPVVREPHPLGIKKSFVVLYLGGLRFHVRGRVAQTPKQAGPRPRWRDLPKPPSGSKSRNEAA